MNAENKELAIVAMLLAAGIALHALGSVEGASGLLGAACALVVPRAGTPTRLAVGGAVVVLMIALGSSGCGTVGKPEVRSAVRLACEVADMALSGEPAPDDEGVTYYECNETSGDETSGGE